MLIKTIVAFEYAQQEVALADWAAAATASSEDSDGGSLSSVGGGLGGFGGLGGGFDDADESDSITGGDSLDDLEDAFQEVLSAESASSMALPVATYKRRADFSSPDEYAAYVRDHLQVGMTIRCCRSVYIFDALCF